MSSRNDRCPVKSREQLINSEYRSDIKFIVGMDKSVIFGHKLLIEPYSPVFYNMFNSDFKEKETGSIEIEDIEPEIFLEMLKYMYTGEVSFTKENLVPVYYASDKYMIYELNEICFTTIKMENVLKVLQINSETYNFLKIREKCLELIEDNPMSVMEQDDFFTLNKKNLELILLRRHYKCPYVDLLASLKRWRIKHEGISVIELENKLLRYMSKLNQCKRLPISGEMWCIDCKTHAIIYTGFKDVKLIGIGLQCGGKLNNLEVRVDRTLVIDKDLRDIKHNGNIVEIHFKDVVIRHSASVEIKVLMDGFRRCDCYFKDLGNEKTKPVIQYLIVEDINTLIL